MRFRNQVATGNANCELAEVRVYGFRYYKNDITALTQDFTCDVRVMLNRFVQTLTQKVTYSNSFTANITSIAPRYGWQLGGDSVTISGSGFGTDATKVKVYIDKIQCVVQAVTATQITCVTGNKGANNSDPPSLRITIDGHKAIVPDQIVFYYGLLWSRIETWGGESQPRIGDSVYVPEGRTLIVDQSTPKRIATVIVEGTLFFADGQDLTFDAEHILIRMGKFIIGSEKIPHTSKLTITLYGKIEDK